EFIEGLPKKGRERAGKLAFCDQRKYRVDRRALVPRRLCSVLAVWLLVDVSGVWGQPRRNQDSPPQQRRLLRPSWRPRISFPLDPTSPTVPVVSSEVIDQAAREAHRVIVKQKALEKANAARGLKASPVPVCPASSRHMSTRVAKDKAIAMDEMAHLFEETTRILSHK
ncbi:hypothetical protein HPB47_002733, partial [Ixodes persulcatus]